MTNTNTSRPLHLGQDPYNDQFNNFDGSDLGSYGLEPLQQTQTPPEDPYNYVDPTTGNKLMLTAAQQAALVKKMGS